MKYEMEGEIIAIDDTKTFDSGFRKREFVITAEDGKYPQDVKFEVIKDNVDLLDKLSTGDQVKVAFNIRGNEFKERYYVNLQAWKIELIKQAEAPAPAEPADKQPDEIPF